MNALCVLAVLLASVSVDFRDVKLPPVRTVPRQMDVLLKAGHIQGAACSEKGIYLSHQLGIEHVGWDGRLIRHLNAPAHLGDIACADGRIYGAFGLHGSEYAKQPGMVCVWDEETFAELKSRRFASELDGVAVLDGVVYVGVGAPVEAHPGCVIKRLDLDLKDIDEVKVDLGYWIHYGVQTMATDGKHVFLGNYGAKVSKDNPVYANCSVLTPDLKVVANTTFGCSEGFAMVPPSIFKRERPVFLSIRALNGNMQGWRKDPVGHPPLIEIAFRELWINP